MSPTPSRASRTAFRNALSAIGVSLDVVTEKHSIDTINAARERLATLGAPSTDDEEEDFLV